MSTKRWLVLSAALVVTAVLLCGCGGGGRPGPQSARGGALGTVPIGSALLGLHPGDRIPAQGRTLTVLTVKSTSVHLDAPLVLYPDAVVQGVAWMPATPTSEGLEMLLATDDPEETVLQYYAAAWKGLPVKRTKPRPALLYSRAAPKVTAQALIVGTGKDYLSSVYVQRGPEIRPMDEHTYAQVLLGNSSLPLQSGGATKTEIWLTAPAG